MSPLPSLSRVASLGASVLGAAAIERPFRVPPADIADVVPSLLLLIASAHLALLAVVLWLLAEPTGAHDDPSREAETAAPAPLSRRDATTAADGVPRERGARVPAPGEVYCGRPKTTVQ